MFSIPENFTQQSFDRFDKDDQLDRLIKECAELIKACCKMKRHDQYCFSAVDLYESLKEEISHVAMSSALVAKIYHITESDVLKEVNKKASKYGFKV